MLHRDVLFSGNMGGLRYLGGAFAVGALFTDVSVAAEEPHSAISIAWRAPPSCPTRQSFVDTLQHALEGKEPRSLRAIIWVEASGEHFVLHLKTRSSEHERTFAGESCGEVVDAAVLVLSLQPPLDQRESTDVEEGADTWPKARRVRYTSPSEVVPVVSAATAFDFGSTKNPLAGINAMFGANFSKTRLEAGLFAFLPVETNETGSPTSTSALVGRAKLSHALYEDFVVVRSYALVDYTTLHRTSLDGTLAHSARAGWAAIGVGTSLEWRYNDYWSLSESVDVGATLISPTTSFPSFSLSTNIYAVIIRAQFGATLRFF